MRGTLSNPHPHPAPTHTRRGGREVHGSGPCSFSAPDVTNTHQLTDLKQHVCFLQPWQAETQSASWAASRCGQGGSGGSRERRFLASSGGVYAPHGPLRFQPAVQRPPSHLTPAPLARTCDDIRSPGPPRPRLRRHIRSAGSAQPSSGADTRPRRGGPRVPVRAPVTRQATQTQMSLSTLRRHWLSHLPCHCPRALGSLGLSPTPRSSPGACGPALCTCSGPVRRHRAAAGVSLGSWFILLSRNPALKEEAGLPPGAG